MLIIGAHTRRIDSLFQSFLYYKNVSDSSTVVAAATTEIKIGNRTDKIIAAAVDAEIDIGAEVDT